MREYQIDASIKEGKIGKGNRHMPRGEFLSLPFELENIVDQGPIHLDQHPVQLDQHPGHQD